MKIVDFILRLYWPNLIGKTFYTWFTENGVTTRRSYQVIGRSQFGKDKWTVRTDDGCATFYHFGGKTVRRCLISKEVIEL